MTTMVIWLNFLECYKEMKNLLIFEQVRKKWTIEKSTLLM
jgi:hypothetical protein